MELVCKDRKYPLRWRELPMWDGIYRIALSAVRDGEQANVVLELDDLLFMHGGKEVLTMAVEKSIHRAGNDARSALSAPLFRIAYPASGIDAVKVATGSRHPGIPRCRSWAQTGLIDLSLLTVSLSLETQESYG